MVWVERQRPDGTWETQVVFFEKQHVYNKSSYKINEGVLDK